MATIYDLREAISHLNAAEHRVDGLLESVLPTGTKVKVGRHGFSGVIKTYSLPHGSVVVTPDDTAEAERHGYRINSNIGGFSVDINHVHPIARKKK